MNTATARPIRHRPTKARLEPIWNRAEFTPVTSLSAHAGQATHDFLVPNPRPDLIFDQRTLRMIEVR
jgi:hypothetical protein